MKGTMKADPLRLGGPIGSDFPADRSDPPKPAHDKEQARTPPLPEKLVTEDLPAEILNDPHKLAIEASWLYCSYEKARHEQDEPVMKEAIDYGIQAWELDSKETMTGEEMNLERMLESLQGLGRTLGHIPQERFPFTRKAVKKNIDMIFRLQESEEGRQKIREHISRNPERIRHAFESDTAAPLNLGGGKIMDHVHLLAEQACKKAEEDSPEKEETENPKKGGNKRRGALARH